LKVETLDLVRLVGGSKFKLRFVSDWLTLNPDWGVYERKSNPSN